MPEEISEWNWNQMGIDFMTGTGTIPEGVGNLTMLELFNLDSNKFSRETAFSLGKSQTIEQTVCLLEACKASKHWKPPTANDL